MTDEIEALRQEILAEHQSDEPIPLDRFAPGSFGCHEALHMCSFLEDAVAGQLLEHPTITNNPEWFELAWRAHDALFTLYQKIGAAHLDNDPQAST